MSDPIIQNNALEHSFHLLLGFSPNTEVGQQIWHWARYQDIDNLESFYNDLQPKDFTVNENTMGYAGKTKKEFIYFKKRLLTRLESLWIYIHKIVPDPVSVFDQHGKISTFYEDNWLKQTPVQF